jgi:hypothetical protein
MLSYSPTFAIAGTFLAIASHATTFAIANSYAMLAISSTPLLTCVIANAYIVL